MKKRVKILLLGGTISMMSNRAGQAEPRLSANELIKNLPALAEIANIEAQTLMKKPSASLCWEDIRICYNAIQQAFDDNVDGVVILQGTDTLEEVAFIFDLLFDDPRPIVVSGAMRPAYLPGADGAANLIAAVSVAVSDDAKGLGALVVMNDLIHAARYVVKAHTAVTDAFHSRLCGPLGSVHEGLPVIFNKPTTSMLRYVLPDNNPPEVGLFPFAFAKTWPYQAMSQCDGVVLELAGSGHVAGDDVAELAVLAKKIPVVFTSRARNGMVMNKTYGYPGSESELIEAGLIPAGQFDGAKARLIVLLALWNKQTINAEMFEFAKMKKA